MQKLEEEERKHDEQEEVLHKTKRLNETMKDELDMLRNSRSPFNFDTSGMYPFFFSSFLLLHYDITSPFFLFSFSSTAFSDSDKEDEVQELGEEGETVRGKIEELQKSLVATFQELNEQRLILANLRKNV